MRATGFVATAWLQNDPGLAWRLNRKSPIDEQLPHALRNADRIRAVGNRGVRDNGGGEFAFEGFRAPSHYRCRCRRHGRFGSCGSGVRGRRCATRQKGDCEADGEEGRHASPSKEDSFLGRPARTTNSANWKGLFVSSKAGSKLLAQWDRLGSPSMKNKRGDGARKQRKKGEGLVPMELGAERSVAGADCQTGTSRQTVIAAKASPGIAVILGCGHLALIRHGAFDAYAVPGPEHWSVHALSDGTLPILLAPARFRIWRRSTRVVHVSSNQRCSRGQNQGDRGDCQGLIHSVSAFGTGPIKQ